MAKLPGCARASLASASRNVALAPSLSSALLCASATGGPAASRPPSSVDERVDLVGRLDPGDQAQRPAPPRRRSCRRAAPAAWPAAGRRAWATATNRRGRPTGRAWRRSGRTAIRASPRRGRNPRARFQPAPTATPVTFATVGTVSSCSASATSVSRRNLWLGWMSSGVAMSAPEQNAPPAPVITNARNSYRARRRAARRPTPPTAAR